MPEAADETAGSSAPPDGRAASVREASVQDTAVQEAAEVERFRRVRRARRSELVDDYVEMIAELGEETGEARQTDIATRLGVSQPTVAKMLKRLIESGHVMQKPYRGVFLTEEGRVRAEASRTRHDLVERFLISIGVSAATARLDAEGIEHHVSDETLAAFDATIRTMERRR